MDAAKRHPRTNGAIVALTAALTLLLTACTGTVPDTTHTPVRTAATVAAPDLATSPESDPAIALARQLYDAPAAVSTGNAVGSCGEFQLGHVDQLPDEAIDCLADAAGTASAELAWTAPTIEGDPIVSFAFVGPGMTGVQVVTTNTFDSWAGDNARWAAVVCPGPHGIDLGSRDACDDVTVG